MKSENTIAPLLQVNNLYVEFPVLSGTVHALQGVSLSVDAGKTLAIVGESGCGKSVTAQAIMGLIPVVGGRVTKGEVLFKGQNIKGGDTLLAGKKMSMIFQDPMNSLNPTLTIGEQIAEPLVVHKGLTKRNAMLQVEVLLDMVEISDVKSRVKQYPFEFSGGMLQRAMIAMSLACDPELLIADEPTTALDVTVQDQILRLLKDIQKEKQMAIIMITHDLGVVARMADSVAVMYGGRVVENGSSASLFGKPSHPYMQGLWDAMARDSSQPLKVIDGSPPDLVELQQCCSFAPRCPYRMQVCVENTPPTFTISDSQTAACWLHHDSAPPTAFGVGDTQKEGSQ